MWILNNVSGFINFFNTEVKTLEFALESVLSASRADSGVKKRRGGF